MTAHLPGWEEWTDERYPGWRDGKHGADTMRAVYARHLDREAYKVPLTEEDRQRVRDALDGEVSFRMLCEATGMDRRTARRALTSLQGRGEVASMMLSRDGRPWRKKRRPMRVYVLPSAVAARRDGPPLFKP